MPATIKPVLPSLLTSAGAADSGAVHAEVTCATPADCCSCATMSVATAREAGLWAPASDPSSVTLITSSMSPWPNLLTSNCVACADSDVGSWKPPADRLLATGMPKIPQATITSAAMATIRLGAEIASNAIR